MSRRKPNYRKQGAGGGRGTYWQTYQEGLKTKNRGTPAVTPAVDVARGELEITKFLSTKRTPLATNAITQLPSGNWGFAGQVAFELVYETRDGSKIKQSTITKVSEADTFGGRFGLMVAEREGLRVRIYKTKIAATKALAEYNKNRE